MNFFDIRSRLQPAAWTVAASLMACMPAWAVDPFTVRDIRVEGLQRIESGTVFASLPLRVGDQYSDEKGAAAIRALFALGLFKDVRLETEGDVLVVVVEERPSVAAVEFIGQWSMLDIFVVILLTALGHFGALLDIEPGAGAACFGAVVVLTMLAAMGFDPRLSWRLAGHRKHLRSQQAEHKHS